MTARMMTGTAVWCPPELASDIVYDRVAADGRGWPESRDTTRLAPGANVNRGWAHRTDRQRRAACPFAARPLPVKPVVAGV